MKTTPTIIICAILSLSIGIAAATPLLVSELEIKPWITHVQGPNAEFDIDLLYANFTVENSNVPLTMDSGPTISYTAVVNVTNPSDYAAKLYGVDFGAGKTIIETSVQNPVGSTGNWTSDRGWEAKGAWVDGVWYNVTYVDGSYPNPFDLNKTLSRWHFEGKPNNEGYWIEGVQVYERTVHNDAGTNTYTYLNMNGTWTDVTGRITVDKAQKDPAYRINGVVAHQTMRFQSGANFVTGIIIITDPNGSRTNISPDQNGTINGHVITTYELFIKGINTGEGGFDNLFAPHESRLIVIQGTYEARAYSTNANPVETLQSGILNSKITTHNAVDVDPVVDDRTFMDTWSDDTAVKQIPLTQIGNSYVYNAVLGTNQKFQFDQTGAEAFIIQES